MNYTARVANPDELDRIYMMGFDVWSDGATQVEYLAGCRASPKYASGTWYVLTADSQPISSLITYKLGPNQIGIGSIATPLNCRRRGYASELIKMVMGELDATLNVPTYFLYADISPAFYERFGFTALLPAFQMYKESICMMRPGKREILLTDSTVPKYF
jgi:hypothetical protein